MSEPTNTPPPSRPDTTWSPGTETTDPEQALGAVKRRPTRKQKLTALGVAFVVLVGAGIAVAATAQSQAEAQAQAQRSAQRTAQLAQATSIPTATPTAEPLPSVESLEIDPALINDPDALAHTWLDVTGTDWNNSGATPANAKAATDSPDIHEFAVALAGDYDALYRAALLSDDWQASPQIVQYVDNIVSIHSVTLELYFKTSFPRVMPEDLVPYRREEVVTLVKPSGVENGSLVIRSEEHAIDNSSGNRVGEELSNGTKVDEATVYPTRYFAVVDGKLKLVDIILG